MKYINEIEKIEPHQINEQIKIREKLINLVLVGNLYPEILKGEIKRLKTLRYDFFSEKEFTL
jgi:hypothetical protein